MNEFDTSKDKYGNTFGYSLSNKIPLEDDRQEQWALQRAERGFDNTELWNLDTTLAKFILPRLKAARQFYTSISEHDMNIIIDGLELMLTSRYFVMSEQESKLVHNARERLYENLPCMWY